MVDVSISPILSSYSSASKLNSNFSAIQTALQKTVGTEQVSTMTVDLDMNDNQLLNLADPTSPNHAITKRYFDETIQELNDISSLPSILDRSGCRDIRDYGAKCDGVTVDDDAWAAALADDDAKAIVVYGTSVISASQSITRAVEIFSYGGKGKLLRKENTTGNMFNISGANIGTVHFHDIELDQQHFNQTVKASRGALYIYNGSDAWGRTFVTCERVTFRNGLEWDIIFYGDKDYITNERLIVDKCTFLGGMGGWNSPEIKPVCIMLVDGVGATITNNFADYGNTATAVDDNRGKGFCWNLMQTTLGGPYFGIVHIENNHCYRMGCLTAGAPGCIDMYHWTKATRILNNKLFDVNGAALDVKTSSRNVIMSGNSVDGITSGSIPVLFLPIPGSVPNADHNWIMENNQVRGARSAPAFAISGNATNGTQSYNQRIIGNQVYDCDSAGFQLNSMSGFSLENNQVKGGTIAYSVLNCSGVNKISGNQSFDTTGAYALYLDNAGVGDYLISDNVYNDANSTAAVYVAARHVTLDGNYFSGGTTAILSGINTSLSILNNVMAPMGSFTGISVGGNISTNLSVQNNHYQGTGTSYSQSGTVTGLTTVQNNSWNRKEAFIAHKNGTDQTGVGNATFTKVTFGTERLDIGDKFSSSTWTPSAGNVRLSASVKISSGITADTTLTLSLYKNGAEYYRTQSPTTSSTVDAADAWFSILDTANGTDTYEVYISLATASSATIHGSSLYTIFAGEHI